MVRLIAIVVAASLLASCSGLWNGAADTRAAPDPPTAAGPADIVITSVDNPFPEAASRCGPSFDGAKLDSVKPVPGSDALVWHYVCVK